MEKTWIKPTFTLLILGGLVLISPDHPLDPYNLIHPRKLMTMIFALALIYTIGVAMTQLLGQRTGSVLTGFLGGLVSSTATTASLAKQSLNKGEENPTNEVLMFLAATGAMLIEGLILVFMGTNKIDLSFLMNFMGPLMVTLGLIAVYSQKPSHQNLYAESVRFQILPILKLSLFIISVLIGSKLLQYFFGEYGLWLLTFLVSLFEIHGSIVANVQLYDGGSTDSQTLMSLLAISVAASYLSKLFLISTLGSARLRSLALQCTLFLSLALTISWLGARFLIQFFFKDEELSRLDTDPKRALNPPFRFCV